MESIDWSLFKIDWSQATLDWGLIGGLAASITLLYMIYSTYKNDKIKLEKDVREAFLSKKEWSNEGVVNGTDTVFFDLLITNPPRHIFSGKILYFDTEGEGEQFRGEERELVFYLEKIRKKTITLRLSHTNGYREHGSSKAKLKYINDDLFDITFSKGSRFSKERFLPNLPRKTQIFPIETSIVEESDFHNNTVSRIITNEIISMISPKRNYDKVKEVLGIAHKTIYEDSSIFEGINDNSLLFDYSAEEIANPKSDIYFLKNAKLKLTTLNGKTIHSVTIFSRDSSLKIPLKFYLCDNYKNTLGDARICQEIVDIASVQSVRARYDSATAIQNHLGPSNGYITYFVDGHLDDDDTQDYNKLIGDKITGFCLSESAMSFYIFDYESN